MTTLQLIIVTSAYLAELLVVVYFTRATSRRVVGALAGGAVAGCFGLGAIALVNRLGLWFVPIWTTWYFFVLFYVGLSISLMPIYLITWRLARRFGWRGLAVFICIVAVIGPPRDYLFAATFPAWMVFAPGIAPVLADSAAYVGIVITGHGMMRLIAGPAHQDRLARGEFAA
jgi:hypothetical protein